MKAWRFDHYGKPDVMILRESPMPTPANGEVLIKVLASGINPSDVKNVAGHFKTATPRVPGRDYSGVIVAGDGREGELVWGSGPGFGVARDGAHAEYLTLPSEWIAPKPSHLSVEQAAAVGVPYLTAWCGLIMAGALEVGETVLLTGVSGAVGRAATQIAHQRRARVIGAGRSSANPSGADWMVDTTRQNWVDEVLALTDGRGVDLVLDAIGGVLFEPCLQTLRHGGRQVAISSNPPVVSFNLVNFYHGMNRLLGVDTMGLSGVHIVTIMERLREGFDDGTLEPPALEVWQFDQAVAAYNAVASAKESRKHVLTMG